MATWTSLAMLSALAVSTLSLPGPDGAYNIPRVGSGRRSQYYVLHSDGTYKYGHDTGEGAFESAKLNTAGDLDGEFGYIDDDGNNVNLQYKSGHGGFVARGDHLPVPHPDFDAAHAEARARPPFVDPLADSGTDASYNFQFADEGLARSEQSDADGNVRGSYTYTDEDGVTRTYSYTAGRGTGFVIEGNDLPQGPAESGLTPAATRFSGNRVSSSSQFSGSRTVGTQSTGSRRTPTSSFSTSNRASSGSRTSGTSFSSSNRASSGIRRTSTTSYSTPNRASRPASTLPSRPFGAATRSGSSTSFSGSAASQRGGASQDGSYSFSYNAGDHSRSESADSNLNVEGQFSFVADDGVQRSVSYESGANLGFQATGDHLPVAPESHFGNRVPSSTRSQATFGTTSSSRRPTAFRTPSTTYTASSASRTPSVRGSTSSTSFASRRPTVSRTPSVRGSTTSTSFTARQPSFPRPQQTYSSTSTSTSSSSRVPVEEANTRSELRPDGSYAFAYEASSHSRAESGDSDNNVDGKFDFVAEDDGQRREIQYEAGSDTGFIAEGAHIPIGPEVPGAPSGQPTGRIVPVQEVPFIDPLADTGLDASYNFAFDSEQYSRSETADADGNVQGTYTVVDDDGTRRTYNFRAGKGVGFETEEVAVSRGPRPSRPATSSTSGSALSSASSSSFHGAGSSTSSSNYRGTGSSSTSSSSRRPSSSSFRGTGASSSSSFRGTGASSSSSFRGTGASSSSSFRGSGASSSSSSTFRGGSGLRTTSYTAPSSSTTSHRQSTSSTGSSSRTPLRSSFTPTSTKEVFPGFQLHQYDASKNPDKFGYVLTFDN